MILLKKIETVMLDVKMFKKKQKTSAQNLKLLQKNKHEKYYNIHQKVHKLVNHNENPV